MIGVLASGSGSNLGALIKSEVRPQIAVIICNNPDAKALQRGADSNIPTVLIDHRSFDSREEFDQALVETLQEHSVEWVILAGFMRIVGPAVLEAYCNRIVNIHPAILPAFPGLNAQEQAIKAGARISGCTVHLVDAGVDSGPILAQAAIPVHSEDNQKTLSRRILALEHVLYPAVVKALLEGQMSHSESRGWHLCAPLELPASELKDAVFSPR